MRPHSGRKHEFQMIKYNDSIQLHCLYAFQLKLYATTCCVVILEIRVSLTPVTSLHTKYIMYVCMQKKPKTFVRQTVQTLSIMYLIFNKSHERPKTTMN